MPHEQPWLDKETKHMKDKTNQPIYRATLVMRGRSAFVCDDCASKYSENDPYDGPIELLFGSCYICKETKPIASSRKLFGLHKYI